MFCRLVYGNYAVTVPKRHAPLIRPRASIFPAETRSYHAKRLAQVFTSQIVGSSIRRRINETRILRFYRTKAKFIVSSTNKTRDFGGILLPGKNSDKFAVHVKCNVTVIFKPSALKPVAQKPITTVRNSLADRKRY